MTARFLCLHLPNWPLQRLLVARPELRRTPLVLYRRDPRRGEVVAACSAEAQQAGVRWGMSLAEGTALRLRRKLHLLPHEPQADHAALRQLAERCEQFTPYVGWETLSPSGAWTAPEGTAALLLDIGGMLPLWPDEISLASAVAMDFETQGYSVVLGLATTIGAAWALAHLVVDAHGLSATRSDQPMSGLNAEDVVPLSAIPVALLRLPPDVVDRLLHLGLERVEQLLLLPRGEIPSRLGPELLLRLDQLLGQLPEWVSPWRPLPQFVVQQRLEYPTEQRERLELVLQELLQQLGALLQQQDRGALQVQGWLRGERGEEAMLEIGLHRPTACPERMWRLLRLRWEQTPLAGTIAEVRLAASLTAALASRQLELFADVAPAAEAAVEELLERLSNRLGRTAVQTPRLRKEVLPERSFWLHPLTGAGQAAVTRQPPRRRRTPRAKADNVADTLRVPSELTRDSDGTRSVPMTDESTAATHGYLQRPLHLLHPPRPVAVALTADQTPQSLCLPGISGLLIVRRTWGPERLETGWWRGRAIRRDYYRVETDRGERYWLFRDLVTAYWYWHGTFS